MGKHDRFDLEFSPCIASKWAGNVGVSTKWGVYYWQLATWFVIYYGPQLCFMFFCFWVVLGELYKPCVEEGAVCLLTASL